MRAVGEEREQAHTRVIVHPDIYYEVLEQRRREIFEIERGGGRMQKKGKRDRGKEGSLQEDSRKTCKKEIYE